MLAAESVYAAIASGRAHDEVASYEDAFKNSWLHEDMYQARNFAGAMHRMGTWMGGAFNFLDANIFKGKMPLTIRDTTPDYAALELADHALVPDYPKPDGKLTFDKLSSVFISNTNHAEDQPAHLKLLDPSKPIQVNLPKYGEPARLYCPAGVYEVVYGDEAAKKDPRFVINAQNCVHCKTCDIKDPSQNIVWTCLLYTSDAADE